MYASHSSIRSRAGQQQSSATVQAQGLQYPANSPGEGVIAASLLGTTNLPRSVHNNGDEVQFHGILFETLS